MKLRDPGDQSAASRTKNVDDPDQELLYRIETTDDPVLTLSIDYPDGHRVALHQHSRSQLLYAFSGVVMVSTDSGRWMVPPEHAVWLPAGVEHSVEMLGDVEMRSVYVRPDEREDLPRQLRVVAITDLARSLIGAATAIPATQLHTERANLVHDLLLHEISNLPERPLALPFPRDPRLVALCREFLRQPQARVTIDQWANVAGMSRRSFTQAFRRETGLGLATWRQQACLFAALPRLAEGKSVTSVALDLGYDSVSAFTTMFRRMLGKPPRAWLSMAKYRSLR
jgi:AraC-like DNA-binding protein/quercetin dioxygenase-like cupin family protein